MNKAYTTWKNNYEAEMKENREKNFRLVYRYQSEYEYYSNSPEWGLIGDFCNFYRIGTLHIADEINARYEKQMLDNINIFTGFCTDEFERIRVWNIPYDYDNHMDYAVKIFEYSGGMKVRYDDLTTNQRYVFRKCLEEHLKSHEDDIELLKKFKEL